MVMWTFIAVLVAGVAGLSEWLHARRVSRVRYMAFGAGGQPSPWAHAVPLARTVAAGLCAWGLLILLNHVPRELDAKPTREASKHLLICLDVSPSMLIEDAGPTMEKTTRAEWAGELVQTILDRLDMETTRVTLYAVYTDALPVMDETFDKDVISNALDGLRMYPAFKPGATDLQSGVAKALERAKVWPKDSATLIVVSDGDSTNPPTRTFLPISIADTIVIGVGNPHRSTMVAGHSSRQDTSSLKLLAARLDGAFHQGNAKHLPSNILDGLSMIEPRIADTLGLRELAMIACGIGASTLAGAGPALASFGAPRKRRRRSDAGATHPAAHPRPGSTS